MIERAGAQPVGGFLQGPVGGIADNAVDEQPAVLLEGAHRVVELGVEQLGRDMPARGQVVVGAVQ